MRRALIVTGAVVAMMAGVACGGGGGGGKALSKEDFVSQAIAICDEGEKRLEKIGQEVLGDVEEGETPSSSQIKDFFAQFSSEVKTQIGDIRDLKPPDDIAGDVEEALDSVEKGLDDFGEKIEDDPQATFESDEDPFDDANEKLAAVGLEDCSD